MNKLRNKDTKSYKLKEIRILKRKCHTLWSLVVRKRAGDKCEICGATDHLHAHHIEDSKLCRSLRYDIRNGLCACARDHKFGKNAAHKSFITMYEHMTSNRKDDIFYLRSHRNDFSLLEYGTRSSMEELKSLKEYLIVKVEELKLNLS
jgi:hypothetical protein